MKTVVDAKIQYYSSPEEVSRARRVKGPLAIILHRSLLMMLVAAISSLGLPPSTAPKQLALPDLLVEPSATGSEMGR